MSGETIECVAHKWHFPPDEVCPVCEGIEFEKERIIKLLEEADPVFTEYAIELIKGETWKD